MVLPLVTCLAKQPQFQPGNRLTQLHRQAKYYAMSSRNIAGEALRGHLENLILAALARGDAHGFELLKRLEEAAAGALKLKEGSLYPALYRLESAGLVEGNWEKEMQSNPRRGPRRRIYRLTKKGRGRLAEARGEFEQFVSVIGGILGASL